MCDQRERLLGYVYDEGDAAERAEVQQHLDQCPDCRTEVAGLRSVRSDLLAWDVPEHDPVWRPFAAAPPVPWWRQVPAWALAAAAAVVLLLGATGSVVAHAMMPDRMMASDNAGVQSAVLTPASAPAVTMADLAAAEQRLLVKLNQQVDEVGARVERVSNSSTSVQTIEGNHSAMAEELEQLRNDYRANLAIIEKLRQEVVQFKNSSTTSHANLEAKIGNIAYLVNSGSK